jgi:hypothetical protein
MKIQIDITKPNEDYLKTIRSVAHINSIDVSNKEKLINLAIKIAYDSITGLDDESLINVCNLKKSI